MAFKPTSPQVNFPQLEKEILKWWYESGLVQKYLHQNDLSKKKFSFLDGPITANNPMGVHHAWGRTYKDLWQRFHTMKGEAGRYQNGFDCQGLWVEVEVEKELGFKNKKDIESYGIANFVNKCKERVNKYSAIQTDQSKRLGYFMDWDHSYFTMSDENNYAIWNFIKKCWLKGWLYQAPDSVPWCPRCETAISQHEMLTEDYKEITHDSIYLELPILNHQNEYLLVWTTTPWTLPANIAVAVDKDIDYSLVKGQTGDSYWLASATVDKVFSGQHQGILKTVKGKELAGLKYLAPFDNLPAVKKVALANPDKFHVVVVTDPHIMPITVDEGTGMVHTAVSAGEEDFKLGKKLGLPMIPVIADNADYLADFGQFSGQNAKKNPHIILDYLKSLDNEGQNWVFSIIPYLHRYPACWRCKTELVWKVADEWYIAMDRPDPDDVKKRTFRQQMVSITKTIKWLPYFGLDRELDWLKNMHDWLISKKNRYWGLALPIYECKKCGHFEVIGDKKELQTRAVVGWEKFNGNSPHRPWIDEVKIACSECGNEISRILDVGNPWLDAGVVSHSTLPADWFPADFITESFPGQFKNWFYSLIAMSTVLSGSRPFKTVLGYASLLAEDGRPMHKSWGNSIEFNEGADKIGVDVMRWLYVTQNPTDNLLFGYTKADATRRRFQLILWNIYNFFITYANIDNFIPTGKLNRQKISVLDHWILTRFQETVNNTTKKLDLYDAFSASAYLENFVNDLSLWYVRRSRERLGPTVSQSVDKASCYHTLYYILVNLAILLAPFMPYLTEEIYKNLTGLESVHLSKWPKSKKLSIADLQLIKDFEISRKIVEMSLAQRKLNQIKVRQPLNSITVHSPTDPLSAQISQLIMDEINVKHINWLKSPDWSVDLDTQLTDQLLAEGAARELIRQVQELRKTQNARLDQSISLTLPGPLPDPQLLELLKKQTLSSEVVSGDGLLIRLL